MTNDSSRNAYIQIGQITDQVDAGLRELLKEMGSSSAIYMCMDLLRDVYTSEDAKTRMVSCLALAHLCTLLISAFGEDLTW